METWMYAVSAAIVAAAVTWWVTGLVHAARAAAVAAERDLLRERVIDLEGSLAEDLETAALLAPLKDALLRVESQVGVLERDRVGQFGALRAVLARVEDETAQLGRSTASLAGSLRSSTVRGSWGEVQLRRVLEVSGMLARCDFEEQVGGRAATGAGVRPDVVVRLPGERSLVVDAKAPMTSFLDAQAEDLDDMQRAELLRDHARQLRGHVEALARKEYWSAVPVSPELVVCFLPSDAMLAAALEAQPGLHEWALGRRVALVGPAALLALLRTVALTWQQAAMVEHAGEVVALGQELYARLATLGAHTAKLGRSLQSTVESYNAMVGALESRVMVSARRMHALGVTTDDLAPVTPVESGPRPLTAFELIETVTAPDARPEAVDLLGQWSEPASSEAKDAS